MRNKILAIFKIIISKTYLVVTENSMMASYIDSDNTSLVKKFAIIIKEMKEKK